MSLTVHRFVYRVTCSVGSLGARHCWGVPARSLSRHFAKPHIVKVATDNDSAVLEILFGFWICYQQLDFVRNSLNPRDDLLVIFVADICAVHFHDSVPLLEPRIVRRRVEIHLPNEMAHLAFFSVQVEAIAVEIRPAAQVAHPGPWGIVWDVITHCGKLQNTIAHFKTYSSTTLAACGPWWLQMADGYWATVTLTVTFPSSCTPQKITFITPCQNLWLMKRNILRHVYFLYLKLDQAVEPFS